MKFYNETFECNCVGKYKFSKKTEINPRWSSYAVGVGNGYHNFEFEKDGLKFMEKYRKAHKDDVYEVPVEQNIIPKFQKMGKIGF